MRKTRLAVNIARKEPIKMKKARANALTVQRAHTVTLLAVLHVSLVTTARRVYITGPNDARPASLVIIKKIRATIYACLVNRDTLVCWLGKDIVHSAQAAIIAHVLVVDL